MNFASYFTDALIWFIVKKRLSASPVGRHTHPTLSLYIKLLNTCSVLHCIMIDLCAGVKKMAWPKFCVVN